MVITLEPGCYFNNYLLDKAKDDPNVAQHFEWKTIDSCRNFGGVRIEVNQDSSIGKLCNIHGRFNSLPVNGGVCYHNVKHPTL